MRVVAPFAGGDLAAVEIEDGVELAPVEADKGLLAGRLRPPGRKEIEELCGTLLRFGLGQSVTLCDNTVMIAGNAARRKPVPARVEASKIPHFGHIVSPLRPDWRRHISPLPPVIGTGLTEPPNHDARCRSHSLHAHVSPKLPPASPAGVLFWAVERLRR